MSQKKTKAAITEAVKKEPLSTRTLTYILGFIALVLYSNTFFHGYVLDDYAVIVNNRIVSQGVSAIPEILSTPYLHGYISNPNDLYRPLSLVMFAIEQQLSGGEPMLSHVINVVLYACCVMVLFVFLDKLFEFKKTGLAFIAALLFALHPIHTEVVANIKSRDELLCFFFGFLCQKAFLNYIRDERRQQLLLGSAFFFLSLLSKETSLSFLLLIPVLFLLWERGNSRRGAHIMTGTVLAIGVFLLIRFPVLNAYDANHPLAVPASENALAGAISMGERVATAVLILGKYLKLLLVPYPLISDYSYNSIPLTGLASIWVWASLLIYASILVIGIRRLLTQPRDTYALSIVFFLVPLAMFTNIVFLVGATMAERFLFFLQWAFAWQHHS